MHNGTKAEDKKDNTKVNGNKSPDEPPSDTKTSEMKLDLEQMPQTRGKRMSLFKLIKGMQM